jgi:hypothetical protein
VGGRSNSKHILKYVVIYCILTLYSPQEVALQGEYVFPQRKCIVERQWHTSGFQKVVT